MATFQGKRVSTYWAVVLNAARDAGVRFTLNSGQRTMTDQWRLYRLYRSGRGNLAAYPTPLAPHIRKGRQDHAIDVNSLDGGETRLQHWLEKHGARMSNPVRGESWHMEINRSDLAKLYRKFRNPFRGYPADEQKWLREYDRKRKSKSRTDKARVKELRRLMTERRKRIYRSAKKLGWRKDNRIKRYASLRARTR